MSSSEALGLAIKALASLYPGYPVAVIWDGERWQAGIIGIELDPDEWLIAMAPVEPMVAEKKAG